MSKIAVVFPGQASQYVGMGKDLYDSHAGVRALYDIASVEIGDDIARISFEGPAEKLKETRYTQPAILLHSLAILTIMGSDFPTAHITAGHSLGEYGSLALAGVISFEDSVRAVCKRAAFMERSCVDFPGTMAAIIGLEEDKIVEICEEASRDGVVVPANFNSSNQIVISGSPTGVEAASHLCKERGAKKVMPLQVGGAFHSPLMKSAQMEMADYLEKLDFKPAKMELVPNVIAVPENNPSTLKKLLAEQITAPVRWHQTMKFFKSAGVETAIEVGPGKVLSGIAKRELEGAQIINIDTLEDIRKFALVGAA
jgi:[acyl-carrier-protein] S-malonyltransferase